MAGTKIDAVLLRLLLDAGLMFIVATAIDTSMDSRCYSRNYSLPTHVFPVHYNVMLIPYTDTFHGKSSIFLEILSSTRHIHLHAYKLQIEDESISLVNYGSNTVRKPQGYNYCTETQILVIEFDDQIASGQYILSMNFNGTLHGDAGFVMTDYTDSKGYTRQAYAVTIFEPSGARRAFPCWDQPSTRTTFNISVVHSINESALSNMPVQRTSSYTPNKIQTHFMTTPDLATYLVTIVVFKDKIVVFNDTCDDYSKRKNGDIVAIWCKQHIHEQLKVAQSVAKKIIRFMSEYMEYGWKEKGYQLAALPYLPAKSVGGWKISIVRKEDITHAQNSYHGRQLQIKMTVAHEMTRRFTESFLSPVKWSELWFYKALTLYLSYYAMRENKRMMELFVVQVQQTAMYNDVLYSLNITGVKSKFDPIYAPLIYKKASAILRMLEHIVTKEVFHQRIIADYMSMNEHHLVNLENFWMIVHATEYEFEKKHGYKLKEVMDTWLSQTSQPTLYVEQFGKNIEIRLVNETNVVKNDSAQITEWKIPLTFTTESELNFYNTTPRYWMIDCIMTIPKFDFSGWIIFNIQQSGYYRVLYSDNLWLKIISYLRGANYMQIHPLNRAQIIDDAYYFVMTDALHHTKFTGLIRYLWKELDFIPWHSMMNVLQYMSPFFDMPQSQTFKSYMLEIMKRFFTHADKAKDLEEINLMKKSTVLLVQKWSCEHGLHQCRKWANNKLTKHLQDPENNPLILGQEAWIYCAGLMNADNNTVNKFTNKFISQDNIKIIQHLACVENDTIIIDLINSVAIDVKGVWTQVTATHREKLYRAIVKKHASKEKVLDFIVSNFNKIMTSQMYSMKKLIDLIMSLYTICDIRKVWPVLKSNVRKTWSKDNVSLFGSYIKLRKRQLANVKGMFNHRFNITKNNKC